MRTRVAIVGSGVSGLVVAHLLHPEHEITVFEARDRVGGHVHTISHEDETGKWSVDTGFIVYNETNYPLFTTLLESLNVATQPSDMSFSVRCDRTGLEYNGTSIRKLFVQKRNLLRLSFHRMIRDILRFNHDAPLAVAGEAQGMTIGDYLEFGRYSAGLAEHYLVPMGSAVWSIPRRKVLDMPADFFVRFFENHGMLTVDDRPQWRVVRGGSKQYVDALTRPFRERIRTSTPVRSVRREAEGVRVNGEPFDEVVLACHSDQALKMLDDATPKERCVLGALPYQSNEVVVHTDATVLPRRKGAWAAWNYHLNGDSDGPATVTYNMNMLQSLKAERTFCVTLNPQDSVDPTSVLYRTRYSHPVYTQAGSEAQGRYSEVTGRQHTHFCGAYWGHGFHEDGVRSAVSVASSFGATL